MIKKIHACNKMNFSSNINEVIRAVLNSFFFYKKISHAPKSTKSNKSTKKHQRHKKAQKHNQAKTQNPYKRTKIKNALKKHLRGKNLFAYLLFCVFCAREEKKIENIKNESLYNVMY